MTDGTPKLPQVDITLVWRPILLHIPWVVKVPYLFRMPIEETRATTSLFSL